METDATTVEKARHRPHCPFLLVCLALLLALCNRSTAQTTNGIYDSFYYSSVGTNVTIGVYGVLDWGVSPPLDVNIPAQVPGVGTVVALSGTFSYADSVASVTIPSTVTDIGPFTFNYAFALSSVVLPAGLTNIGAYAFNECGIGSANLPPNLLSIGDNAFNYCDYLGSISIPASVISIGNWPFYQCFRLPAINVDPANPAFSSMDGVLFNKDQSALIEYPAIRRGPFTIPDTVTTVFTNAFNFAIHISSLTVPGSVTNLGDNAFANCGSLTNAIFLGDAPSHVGVALFYAPGPNFTINYPANAKGWSTPTWDGYPAQPYLPAGVPVLSLTKNRNNFTPAFANLLVGTNYQLLVSTDLANWTNSGAPFSAQNSTETNALTFSTTNSPRLFFRLESTP
jgi:hypothetical protein